MRDVFPTPGGPVMRCVRAIKTSGVVLPFVGDHACPYGPGDREGRVDGRCGGRVSEETKDVRHRNEGITVVGLGVAHSNSEASLGVLPGPSHGWVPGGWTASTASVAKIGTPARRAMATASLGRESIRTSRPSTFRTRVAI